MLVTKIRWNPPQALKIRGELREHGRFYGRDASVVPQTAVGQADRGTPHERPPPRGPRWLLKMRRITRRYGPIWRGRPVWTPWAGTMSRMQRKAFTLVELLVVVAVIAVLISLLLPAINRFRVQAQSTECMTNQLSCFRSS